MTRQTLSLTHLQGYRPKAISSGSGRPGCMHQGSALMGEFLNSSMRFTLKFKATRPERLEGKASFS